ncbi:hypothetical protein DT603_12180 [Pseudoxanthomonas gei]|uniref:Uncharacterized protein n=2 Tax=Pseudoxanthomonas gei TaxID=1383030 RepID=A0ABX0AHJ2_9GAMM|nr:hypothetical protein [Pseudoxanthomonas gei]
MSAILEGREVTAFEMSQFLDWLDKVRVGLWLGFRQLDKNFAGIDPNYHIDDRIGQYDRVLLVEKTDMPHKRLNISGVDGLSFALTPSAFVLTVNNYYFTNISYQFLLARRIGFPYPEKEELVPDGRLLIESMHEGRKRTTRPILRHPIRPGGVIVYQPMFKGGLVEPQTDLYDTEYVRSHSLDFNQGVGSLLVEDRYGLREKLSGESFSVEPSVTYPEIVHRFQASINVYQWQNWLATLLPYVGNLPKPYKNYVVQRWAASKRLNNALIAYCKLQLRRAQQP